MRAVRVEPLVVQLARFPVPTWRVSRIKSGDEARMLLVGVAKRVDISMFRVILYGAGLKEDKITFWRTVHTVAKV